MPEIVAPGDRLGERYVLEAPLGAGGMATVWRATDLVLDRAVAVKVPADGWPDDLARRLRQEAKAAAGLAHPSITGVYDYGEDEVTPRTGRFAQRRRVPYVVMELLDGETLAARLARGPMPWREAAATGARIADALAAAHAAGIVHRDIKPANVFLTPVGVKVLDFGIAFTGTSGGPVLGTPAYVAPELLTGVRPAPAADVFSLGVVLNQALTGGAPAPALGTPPEGVPAEVVELCRRCLDEDPGSRPAASEAARVLADAAGVQLAPFPHVPPVPEPEPEGEHHPTRVLDEPPPGAPHPAEPAARPSGRKPLVIAGAAVGAAGLAALLIGLTTPGSSGSPDAADRPSPSPSRMAPTTAATACTVAYRIDGSWPQGFQATVRITNLGTAAIDGWRLAFDLPDGQSITQLWNGGQQQDGASVTVTAADWNRSIPPHGTVEFGFLGKRDGGGGRPSRFTLNGGECR
ncbi:protein kinase domain-containing protein [Actinomadura violacea]|uniref:non-specific serine/threonine protein kinase n=1 Tax=Actinomadura violacea TaxID=2819934 RepID=A0ABS3RZN5_9ACTN|nr:cellulose binding domain-containing protein [Actinomadura violacea]MBO2462208.1 cellulose binding domain-containing protein [Actinomadura violacea]